MRVTVLLADAAQTDPNGKAHILGAGWSRSPAGPIAMAVVVFLELDWAECNIPLQWSLQLLKEDGQPATVPGPAGPQVLSVEGGVEGGRPPGTAAGSPIVLPPISVNMPPTPLEAGRYEWRFSIRGHGIEETAEHRAFDKAG